MSKLQIESDMNIQDEPLLMKSKERVQKHGEVFTPQWIVDKMLEIPSIKEKTEDIFATFLEPSAGEGVFLLAIENLKFKYITKNCVGEKWKVNALWVLASIYGIEFLKDNLMIARQDMLNLFLTHYKQVFGNILSEKTFLYKSAQTIIWANIVHGNALTHKNNFGEEIVFFHWKLVSGTTRSVQRIPFTYSSLFPESDIYQGDGMQMNLFGSVEQLNLFDIDGRKEPKLQKYKIVDIEHVWKEEIEYV